MGKYGINLVVFCSNKCPPVFAASFFFEFFADAVEGAGAICRGLTFWSQEGWPPLLGAGGCGVTPI